MIITNIGSGLNNTWRQLSSWILSKTQFRLAKRLSALENFPPESTNLAPTGFCKSPPSAVLSMIKIKWYHNLILNYYYLIVCMIYSPSASMSDFEFACGATNQSPKPIVQRVCLPCFCMFAGPQELLSFYKAMQKVISLWNWGTVDVLSVDASDIFTALHDETTTEPLNLQPTWEILTTPIWHEHDCTEQVEKCWEMLRIPGPR